MRKTLTLIVIVESPALQHPGSLECQPWQEDAPDEADTRQQGSPVHRKCAMHNSSSGPPVFEGLTELIQGDYHSSEEDSQIAKDKTSLEPDN